MLPRELNAALALVPFGVLVVDEHGVILQSNDRLRHIFGYDEGELEGRSVEALVPELAREHAALRTGYLAAPTPRPMGPGRATGLRKDSSQVPLEVHLNPAQIEGHTFVLAYVTDVTEQKAEEDKRAQFLLDASRAFSEAIEDSPLLAQTIARTCTLMAGDVGVIYLLSEDGRTLEVAATHHDESPLGSTIATYVQEGPRLAVGESFSGRVVQSGEPIFIPRLGPNMWEGDMNAPRRALLEQLADHSLLVVPMRARGSVIGCISLLRITRGSFTQDERALLQRVANSAALAVQNSRAYTRIARAEAEIRELQRTVERQAVIYETMLRQLPRGAVFLLDAERRYISAQGPSVRAVLGVSGDGLVGKRLDDIVPEAYRDDAVEAVATTLSGQAVHRDAQRGDRIYEIHGAPIYAGEPKPVAALMTLYDVTERAEQTQALRRERERFRALVEQAPVGVFEITPLGEIIFASQRWLELTGLSAEDAKVRERRMERIHPDDRARVERITTEARERGAPFRLAFRFHRPDGALVYLASLGSPVFEKDGRVSSFIGVTEDVTLARESELKTEQALREKETLLAEIHHRVKNNLQVIGSILNLQADSLRDDELRAVIADIRHRVHAIALLHERLYRTSDFRAVAIGEYIEGLVRDIAHAMSMPNAHTRVFVEGAKVQLDLDHAVPLGLLVNELVTNAFKHGRRGDSAHVSVRVEGSERRLRVVVEDDGPGFPGGSPPKNGRTLGLFLVASLARQLRADVSFQSTPTRCTVDVPLPSPEKP